MLVHMDVRSIVSVIFRQLWKFLLVFIPIVLIGLLYALTAPRYYESGAKILVKFGEDARPEMSIDSTYRGGLSAEEKRGMVQSNLNILVSRDLLEALLKEVTVAAAYPDIGKLKISEDAKLDAALKMLSRNIKTETESDAGLIKVSILHEDPKTVHQMLSTMVDIFIRRQSEIYGNPQTEVLRDQAQGAKKRLEEADKAFYEFKMKTGITSIDEELTILVQQRADLTGYLSRRTQPTEGAVSLSESDYENPPADTEEAEQEGDVVTSAIPARIAKSGDNSRFPVVEDVQKRIDALRAKESELLLTYKPNSQMVRNVRKNIALEEEALRASVGALEQQIADLNKQISEKQEFRSQYNELNRNVEASKEAFEAAQARLRAAEINNDLNTRRITRISLLEEPSMPFKPSKPNKKLIVLLSILIGGAFGAALGFGAELMDSSFTRPEQAADALKRPVLAAFPDWNARVMKPLPPARDWKRNIEALVETKKMPDLYEPLEAGAKHFPLNDLMSLAQRIEIAMPGKEPRVLGFASCQGGEGATTIGYEFAHLAASRLEQRVLFIGHHNYVPASADLPPRTEASLLEVALGNASSENAYAPFAQMGGRLSYAFLARPGEEEAILPNIEKIKDLLESLKEDFSLIILPVSGMLMDATATMIAKTADGAILVLEAERTRAPVAKQAIRTLTENGVNLLGLVLNKQRYYIPAWLYRML
jgi:succinoglycan biosynthesis transport protein ExoP